MDQVLENIYQAAVDAGIPIEHHESDLYLPITEKSKELVNSYRFKQSVTRFTNRENKVSYFDIPFAYTPYWEAKRKK